MEDNKDVIDSINWNNILKLDARSIDRTNLGQVQGLFEPCVVVQKGTLNKETYYIPKSVIETYDDEALYFRLTEQEVRNNCLRESPPSEEDAEQIRITAERIASTQRSIVLHSENREEEVLGKLREAVSEFKDRVSSGAKRAKEKVEESQIQKDEQKISKMGELAATLTDSFDQVMSEIKTHTYAEQEEIYDGFMKLLEKQREFVSARKELSSRLKSSVKESPNTLETKKQNLEEGRSISRESTIQSGGFVPSTNVASGAYSMLGTPADNNTKIKAKEENRFMVIEPPPVKYLRVAVKPSYNKTKKRKEGVKENEET